MDFHNFLFLIALAIVILDPFDVAGWLMPIRCRLVGHRLEPTHTVSHGMCLGEDKKSVIPTQAVIYRCTRHGCKHSELGPYKLDSF